MAMPSAPNTNAGRGTNPGEARTIPTMAVNTINTLTLGFVSERYSRHPGWGSVVISGSWGAIAMGSGWFLALSVDAVGAIHGACLLSASTLPLHLHQSIHGHHVVVQMSHDDHRSEYQETHNKNAKGER